MRKTRVVIAGLMVLAGCSAQDGGQGAEADYAVDAAAEAPSAGAAPAPETRAVAPAPPAQAPAGQTAPTPVAPVSLPQIAYVYRYGLELPTDRIPALVGRHEQACVAAGPAVCQVVGSNSARVGRDDLTATLEIRAVPAYVAALRGRLAADAEGAGGRVDSATTESEDLTRALTDTEAQLRALTTLRDRLQQHLATRAGSLEDLLKVETELARVQGEVDATLSNLEVMRARVATSRLTIQYQSAGQLAPDSAFRPVTNALDGALGVFMGTLGVLITLFAILLPVALIVVPLVWFLLRRRRVARARRAAEAAPADAPLRDKV